MSLSAQLLFVSSLALAITSIVTSQQSKPPLAAPRSAAVVAVPQIGTLMSRIVERTDAPRARVIYPNYLQADNASTLR